MLSGLLQHKELKSSINVSEDPAASFITLKSTTPKMEAARSP